MQCALHAARRWHPNWAGTERIGLGVIAEADAGTESRGTGGQFETVADDVVTTAGLVCWVWVYGCHWNSLDDLCWRGRKNRLQSRSSLVTSAKKELGNQRLTALVNVSFPEIGRASSRERVCMYVLSSVVSVT